MEFMSTLNEVATTQVDTLLEITERLIALRDACEHDSQRRSACVKLYEGSIDPTENFGLLGINHAIKMVGSFILNAVYETCVLF